MATPLHPPAHATPRRRGTLRALATGAATVLLIGTASLPAFAHHGWAWAEDSRSELTGTIVAVKLGNPHGELTLDVGGAKWVVEVGQPWRNEQAGLKDELLAKGVKLTITGHRATDPKLKVFKAERVMIGDRRFDLYPDRK